MHLLQQSLCKMYNFCSLSSAVSVEMRHLILQKPKPIYPYRTVYSVRGGMMADPLTVPRFPFSK
jgi:hypothetical protein